MEANAKRSEAVKRFSLLSYKISLWVTIAYIDCHHYSLCVFAIICLHDAIYIFFFSL